MAIRPHRHCRNRQLEWWPAGFLVGLGCWTLIWPDAFGAGRFAAIDNLFTLDFLTALLLAIGVIRLASLYANGRMPVAGPFIRMLCALLSGALFLQMGIALWVNHLTTGLPPSPGIVVYIGLALQEAHSAIRAAGDARFKPRP